MKLQQWQEELRLLHLESIQLSTPGAFKASGGYEMKIKPYIDTNTNGLTRCVLDYLKYKGHYAIRTARQGQARIERVQMHNHVVKKLSWTKNAEAKAYTDIQATISGLSVAIEIKCKATKDKFDKQGKQEENGRLIQQAGGIWLVVPDFLYFYNWYNNELPKIKKERLK